MRLNLFEQSVILMRFAVLVAATYYLFDILKNRLDRFMGNAIVYEMVEEEANEVWFGAAVCFGPKFTKDTIRVYKIGEHLRSNSTRNDDMEKRKKTLDAKKIHVSKAVDTLKGYQDFYLNMLDWDETNMYSIGMDVYMVGTLHLGNFESQFSANNVSMTSNADFFTFKYVLCTNYSYSMRFTEANEEEAWHKISLNWTQFNWLLEDNRISEYVDVYIYPTGHFSEFPLIADHVPFRVDLATWQRLRGKLEKITRIHREGQTCVDDQQAQLRDYSSVNCLTWCLRRTLLRRVKCTIPQLDAYIYNMTKVMHAYTMVPTNRRRGFRSCNYFNASTAHPWMQEFLKLRLCRTRKDFEETFNETISIFFPKGHHRYPLDSNCSMECLPLCTQDRVLILTEGIELQVPTPKSEQRFGVTIHFTNTINHIMETWIYQLNQLLIDVSGVMSFLLGVSLTAMHDWFFALIEWLEKKRSKNYFEGYYDDEGNYYDEFGYYDTEGNYYEYEDDYDVAGTSTSQYLDVKGQKK